MPLRLVAAPPASAALITVAALLAACGSSSPTTTGGNSPPPAAQSNDINIAVGAQTKAGAAFSPNPKTVSLGGAANVQVRFVNRDISGGGGDYTQGDAVVHHIVSDPDAPSSFDVGSLGGNDVGIATFTAAGTYPYHCANHPNMVGTIEVTP
jgi:plastocyanin